MNGDDLNVHNGEMYENTHIKITGKYAYCNDCNKRLFEVAETDILD